ICISCTSKEAEKESMHPTRGVWLTNVVSEAMFSQGNIEKAIKEIKDYGFNSVFVVCWNRGYTLYPSEVMEEEFGKLIDPKHVGRDPLQEVIDAAKKHGLKTYAWFEFGFSSSYEEADGGHILRQKPQWAALDTAGQIVSKNRFQWMNAFDPEVQGFVLSLLKEVVEKYEVDGIQGDDRLPALPSMAGYETYTLQLYRDKHQGSDPPRDIFDSAWVDWRANLLNQFMGKVHAELKALDPEIEISVSPSIYPWSKEQYLQDWPTWVEEGWVDMVPEQMIEWFDAHS
ncbi:glycoside hydrolase family 10 protein, partial [Okeania hirsuta]|uniref:glycoside hydrolase family 10 protein n=1 Tax=Okeania hirsuta TaxID=1458930 RepID=UPI000F52DE38